MKTFLFKTYIETAVGARGYICVNVVYKDGVYHVDIGNKHIVDKTLPELMNHIHETFSIVFLEPNVVDYYMSEMSKSAKL